MNQMSMQSNIYNDKIIIDLENQNIVCDNIQLANQANLKMYEMSKIVNK